MSHLDASKKINVESNFRANVLTKIAEKLQKFLQVPKIKTYSLDFFECCKKTIVKSIKSNCNEKQLGDPNDLIEGINLNEEISPHCCLFEIPNSSLNGRLKKYYEKSEIIETRFHEIYQKYRLKPETHPLYDEEWKIFYYRKNPSFASAKIAVNSEVYKKDWIKFWVIRLEELHYEEINKHKQVIQEELNLTPELIRRDEENKMDKIIGKSRFKNRRIDEPDSDEFIESCIRDPKIPRRKRRRRCVIDELHYLTNYEILDPKRYELDAPGTVFSVCRQVLAFEDVYPAFIDSIRKIYIKSAELEKKKYLSSEELLMNDETLILFTTIKEKLWNILADKSIADWKIRCAQRTAQQLNAMVYETEYRKQKTFKIKESGEEISKRWIENLQKMPPKRKKFEEFKEKVGEKSTHIMGDIFRTLQYKIRRVQRFSEHN